MPILCERFTTSKLKEFEDLQSIGTYGFRGEALASISHIARLTITTRTTESSCAWRAQYESGKLKAPKEGQSSDPKPCAGRRGTQITVEDLFYNVPTRRKAFRSANDEYHKIMDLVSRYAVHCSGVAFSCKKHGSTSMDVTVQAAATTIERIRAIHGGALATELIEFDAHDEAWGFKSTGYISNANYSMKKMALLLFINHRSVESSNIKRAIEQTYSFFLKAKGAHPFIYLSLEIDPARVDVNIHPTKREVNFLNEDEIIEKICDEIRLRLGHIDTSRSFQMQSLLPGVTVPTISVEASPAAARSPAASSTARLPRQGTQHQGQRTPASSKPYENSLVRTDSKLRTITSMLPPAQRSASIPSKLPREDSSIAETDNEATADTADPMEYEYEEREHTICRLLSIKELRGAVRDAIHNGLTDVFATHTWVGIIDEAKRLVAVQAGVKLFLVDYGMICNEFFYQLGLTDFGNFGVHRFDPPLDLREVLRVGADFEKSIATPEESESTDWMEVVEFCHESLMTRRDMLQEYFSVVVSEDGLLVGVPLLIKGYMPSLAKLPRFVLRLGPLVDWTHEKGCFHSFLRELAAWYTPEPMPPSPRAASEDEVSSAREDPEIAARRRDVHRALEHVLFPAFKARLLATKGMLQGVLEIANLKGLYRVFERC